mgnify:CR=1 FL=1
MGLENAKNNCRLNENWCANRFVFQPRSNSPVCGTICMMQSGERNRSKRMTIVINDYKANQQSVV